MSTERVQITEHDPERLPHFGDRCLYPRHEVGTSLLTVSLLDFSNAAWTLAAEYRRSLGILNVERLILETAKKDTTNCGTVRPNMVATPQVPQVDKNCSGFCSSWCYFLLSPLVVIQTLMCWKLLPTTKDECGHGLLPVLKKHLTLKVRSTLHQGTSIAKRSNAYWIACASSLCKTIS